MGTNLTLLPFDCDKYDGSFSHTVLCCLRSETLFEKIRQLPALPTPKIFNSYKGRGGYGQTSTDSYSARLKYTTIENLLLLSDEPEVLDSKKNIAIWAYLGELDPDTKVALYWS